jgi:hypothetical protein
MTPPACLLHARLGRETECPGEACAFWDDACSIEDLRLDLDGREEIAAYLLQLRERLEVARDRKPDGREGTGV